MADEKLTKITILSDTIIKRGIVSRGDVIDIDDDSRSDALYLIANGQAAEGEQKLKAAPANKAVSGADLQAR
ncbi:hypothetical protein [Aestuariivirga litoralis]|uniref:hypothetical protein n=1 Tax=Aestuariivirga litoralis TaxID=2650924 RepID=UPI0018C5F918|nr:hypothetical protein [Aestuariivirga litoralis]MBG1232978.1 hypothetical protein [Aestuariivirga litoralis]